MLGVRGSGGGGDLVKLCVNLVKVFAYFAK